MDVDEFFKYRHESEIARSEELAGRARIIISVLTALAGVAGYLILHLRPAEGWPNDLHVVVLTLSVAAIVVSMLFLAWSYHVAQFLDLAPSTLWRRHWLDLLVTHASATGGAAVAAKEEFEADLIERLAECADVNKASNDVRGQRLRLSNVWLVIGAILTIVATLLHLFLT